MQRQFDAVLTELFKCNNIPLSDGGPAVLLAVSGGVDSICLAELCLHSSLALRPVVAHCNFHLRGEESDGDEAFVRAWGSQNGVEVRVADFDTVSYSREKGVSVEMAARELRYGWFAQLCGETGSRAVLVAHNANDNAETLMLNLLRGTGLRGLSGMRTSSPLPCGEGSGSVLLRPLLGFTRKQIEGYARAHGISWREDSTNADSEFKRNKIRNEVFPLLETINPSFVKTLNREMRYFADAETLIRELAKPEKLVRGGRININELTAEASWPYLLYLALEPYGFNSATVAEIEDLLKSPERTLSGKTFRSATHVVVTSSKELIICEGDGFEGPVNGSGASALQAEGRRYEVEVVPRSEITDLHCPAGTLYFDADKLRLPVTVRGYREGDWMRPFGMNGQKKKVSDMFTDLKYNSLQKASALFVAGEDSHVLALLGVRIDESVKIGPETTSVAIIRVY